MSFRRGFAGFFVFLFVVFSMPTFLIYAVSNTFLKPTFYQGQVSDGTYHFLVSFTSKRLLDSDKVIFEHFNQSDLEREMETVFPVQLFHKVVDDFSKQLEAVRLNPRRPMVLSLKVFRESLLTFAHNLSFRLFESFPKCKGGEIPDHDTQGLPTCVPNGVEYNLVAAPFAQQFEASVYSVVPEQMQIDLNAAQGQSNVTPASLLDLIVMVRSVAYGSLLFLLVVVSYLVYKPFSLIAKFLGFAFFISGALGFLFAYGLVSIPHYVFGQMTLPGDAVDVSSFIEYLFSFVTAEVQKVSLIFMGLGAILILVRVFMTHYYNNEQGV